MDFASQKKKPSKEGKRHIEIKLKKGGQTPSNWPYNTKLAHLSQDWMAYLLELSERPYA